MDQSLFETLLLKGESDTLDFKRDQYLFEGASDEAKSKLLKDVLAFANAWRNEDAYILIGVEELKGGRARMHGITQHLEDASLQQFVSAKTQKPVRFRYEAIEINGLSFGIISIPVQERPAFLLHGYGGLSARVVYVRRGSSTDEADPDEIAKMGLAQSPKIASIFSVIARPEILQRGSFEELRVTLWLHNTGTGTGDDIVVIDQESPVGTLGVYHQFWMDAPTGNRGRAQRLKNPIHPHENVPMFSVSLGKADHVIAFPPMCRFVLKVSARNRPMLNFVGEFSPDEIRALQVKTLELREP